MRVGPLNGNDPDRSKSQGAEGGEGVRVAVLTLTRDRLAYTRHCFATLERSVLGVELRPLRARPGLQDGTVEYLAASLVARRT